MIMLEIKGVKKSYGEFQLDCSLNVEKGRITGLVGENGAGSIHSILGDPFCGKSGRRDHRTFRNEQCCTDGG